MKQNNNTLAKVCVHVVIVLPEQVMMSVRFCQAGSSRWQSCANRGEYSTTRGPRNRNGYGYAQQSGSKTLQKSNENWNQ